MPNMNILVPGFASTGIFEDEIVNEIVKEIVWDLYPELFVTIDDVAVFNEIIAKHIPGSLLYYKTNSDLCVYISCVESFYNYRLYLRLDKPKGYLYMNDWTLCHNVRTYLKQMNFEFTNNRINLFENDQAIIDFDSVQRKFLIDKIIRS